MLASPAHSSVHASSLHPSLFAHHHLCYVDVYCVFFSTFDICYFSLWLHFGLFVYIFLSDCFFLYHFILAVCFYFQCCFCTFCLQCSLHSIYGHRLWSEEICNEYAAQTMLCQSKPFRLKKARKAGFCLNKMPKFQNQAWKKPKWQTCIRDLKTGKPQVEKQFATRGNTRSKLFIFFYSDP